jgi:hypothetical protein
MIFENSVGDKWTVPWNNESNTDSIEFTDRCWMMRLGARLIRWRNIGSGVKLTYRSVLALGDRHESHS